MTYYDKDSKPFGFIVYSGYGCMSHVVMNQYGVAYTCNPKTDERGKAIVYRTREEAVAAKDKFFDRVAEVILITKYEMDGDLYEYTLEKEAEDVN